MSKHHTLAQQVALSDWFRKLVAEFQEERPSKEKVATQATEELGFDVTPHQRR